MSKTFIIFKNWIRGIQRETRSQLQNQNEVKFKFRMIDVHTD